MIQAGRRDKRVAFQEPSNLEDEGGGYSVGWGHVVEVWGDFRPETGRERMEAGRLNAALGGRLWVLDSVDTRRVTEQNRVMIDGDVYNVRSVAPPVRGQIEMTVEKGVAT